MPKPLIDAARRLHNRARAREARQEAHREAMGDRASARRKASAQISESRLLEQIERMERHPSPLALTRLRTIAADTKLPAAPRAAAAAVVLRWAEDPSPRKLRRGTRTSPHAD